MKISVFAVSAIAVGKHNVKDERLDQVDKITRSKKKTYVQLEAVGEEDALLADAILVAEGSRADLVLKDLEFVETRFDRAATEQEKAILNKMKAALEKEQFVSSVDLDPEEREMIASYGLYTMKPVVVAKNEELENPDEVLARALSVSGYISFFTTGEKETRAWLIKKGITAWEAAGSIHSDIQRGFIRAEIISFNDFIQAGGESAAKQQGKMRLEPKEYVMQDADLTNFRFNK